jgi:clan AA aspartic protease
MGLTRTEITLKNGVDVIDAQRGYINKNQIRQMTVSALVDTGAGTLVITEALRQKLGLEVKGLHRATLTNGSKEMCKVTEPVEIQWRNRDTSCRALVVPDDGEVLLGAIPLEDMDLVVDPVRQELVGAHGDEVLYRI